jgi:hypothetical protein
VPWSHGTGVGGMEQNRDWSSLHMIVPPTSSYSPLHTQ